MREHTRVITSEQQAYIDTLVTVLTQRGFSARALRGGIVRAENPAARAEGSGSRLGRALFPGLRQQVACVPRDDHGPLWWHWVWPGATPATPDEFEPLCAAGELTVAADRITTVLALQPEEES